MSGPARSLRLYAIAFALRAVALLAALALLGTTEVHASGGTLRIAVVAFGAWDAVTGFFMVRGALGWLRAPAAAAARAEGLAALAAVLHLLAIVADFYATRLSIDLFSGDLVRVTEAAEKLAYVRAATHALLLLGGVAMLASVRRAAPSIEAGLAPRLSRALGATALAAAGSILFPLVAREPAESGDARAYGAVLVAVAAIASVLQVAAIGRTSRAIG